MSVILYSRERWGVCKCGHYDWQHNDSIPDSDRPVETWARGEGHGFCGAKDCDCRQFTWVKSIPQRRNIHTPPLKLEACE